MLGTRAVGQENMLTLALKSLLIVSLVTASFPLVPSSLGKSLSLTDRVYGTTTNPNSPVWPAGTSLTASNIGPRSLTLSWTAATGALPIYYYRLYEDGNVIATVPGWGGMSYDVTALSPSTTYTFKVEAGDSSNNWTNDGPSLNVATVAETPGYDFNISIAPASLVVSNLRSNSGSGNFNVTLTALGGFIGLVNITATVSSKSSCTSQGPIPQVLGDVGSVFLGELRNVEKFYVGIYTSNSPAGSYAVALTGAWGDRMHEADANLEVVSADGTPTVCMLYQLGSTGSPTVGKNLLLFNNFTDLGQSQVRVTKVTYALDRVNQTSDLQGLPLTLSSNETQTVPFVFKIPSTASAGEHFFSATVQWEYYFRSWQEGKPILVSGSLDVRSNPPIQRTQNSPPRVLSAELEIGLASYALVVASACLLVVRYDRKKQRRLLQPLPGSTYYSQHLFPFKADQPLLTG